VTDTAVNRGAPPSAADEVISFRRLHEACPSLSSSGGSVAGVCAAAIEAAPLLSCVSHMTAGVSCTIKLWQVPSCSSAFREYAVERVLIHS
jgi:hypothetical protein